MTFIIDFNKILISLFYAKYFGRIILCLFILLIYYYNTCEICKFYLSDGTQNVISIKQFPGIHVSSLFKSNVDDSHIFLYFDILLFISYIWSIIVFCFIYWHRLCVQYNCLYQFISVCTFILGVIHSIQFCTCCIKWKWRKSHFLSHKIYKIYGLIER